MGSKYLPAASRFQLFLGVLNPWWNTRNRFWYITLLVRCWQPIHVMSYISSGLYITIPETCKLFLVSILFQDIGTTNKQRYSQNLINLFVLQSEFENKDDGGANLFDPDGLLYFPVFFTCLGVTAFLMMIGGAWDVYRRFNCLESKRGLFAL